MTMKFPATDDPYWWEEAPLPVIAVQDVQSTSDVVIVGAGYTGLSAAITLARAGRSVQVFDKQRPGEGASSRNGGMSSAGLRYDPEGMEKRYGKEHSDALYSESKLARQYLYDFMEQEKVECDFKLVGSYRGATSPGAYEALVRKAAYLKKKLNIDIYTIPKSEQHSVLGTDRYHGGTMQTDIGGLHPAKLHAEFLRVAISAGVIIHSETPVLKIKQQGEKQLVTTSRGEVVAENVITATNGYTDKSDRWLRRRIVPVRSRIIATAPLEKQLMKKLMPRQVMVTDTRNVSYYFRPSPDGTRILFGGRDGTVSGSVNPPTEHLYRSMLDIFPELDGIELTHSWFGFVAMNRNMIPGIYNKDNIKYVTGFCGSGVVWAPWAGRKAALMLLGDQEGGTSAFNFTPPPAVPFFNGHTWFMPGMFAWMNFKDKFLDR